MPAIRIRAQRKLLNRKRGLKAPLIAAAEVSTIA